MSKSNSKKSDAEALLDLELPLLEELASTDLTPGAQGAVLLDSGAVALNATRLGVVELLLTLSVKDIPYEDFMRELLLLFLKGIKCEAGSLFETDPGGTFLFFRAVSGQQSDLLKDVQIPVGKGIVGFVHESRQVACVQDCENDPRFLRTVGDAVGFETRNLIAAPIVIRDQVFCVVELVNRIGEPGFSEEDVELVRYFSEFAAKAIEIRLMLNWKAQSHVSAPVGTGVTAGRRVA
jgi:hypothetical protein